MSLHNKSSINPPGYDVDRCIKTIELILLALQEVRLVACSKTAANSPTFGKPLNFVFILKFS